MARAEKLSIREKLGYSLGDCAANFVFQTQLIFMMSFYTDVFGISAATVGWIFLLSRLMDAVTDPLMGALADRTNTRWGKFRPWILWSAIPFAICFVLAFTTPDLSTRGKIVWAYVTYNLLMIAYTANNIPYSAMTGVLSSDGSERTSLTAWRFILALTAGFFVQTFTLDLVAYFGQGDDARGYQLTVTIWAVIAVVFFVITFATTKERVQPDPRQKGSFLSDTRDLLANGPWVALSVMTLFIFVLLSMRGGTMLYYFRYYLQREDLFGWFNAIAMITSMLGILLSRPISRRIGKRDTFRIGLFTSMLITAVFYHVSATSIATIFVLQSVWSIAYGITVPILWTMMADVADYSEWKTGRRATAMTFAATVLALKIGLSIGSASTGWLLSHFGYVPNVEQKPESLHGILLMISYIPAAAFALGFCSLCFYQIDKATEQRIEVELRERRDKY